MRDVVRAHAWWHKGELETRWDDPPYVVCLGIEIYAAAVNAVQAHDFEKEREERERRRDLEADAPPARGRGTYYARRRGR